MKFPSLVYERNVKCYNEYFFNGMSFILNNMVQVKRAIIVGFV